MNTPVNVTPPPPVDSSHRLLTILCHAATFFGAPLLVPLIVYLVTKKDHNIVTVHAAEALNFHLSYALWALLCLPFVFIGIGALMWGLLAVAVFVLAIVAVVKAANDEVYRYPLTLRLVGDLPPRSEVVRER